MPKFQVPQFIETETKLIGPLTLRQVLFVAGGVSMTAMAYVILPTFFFFIAALLILAFFGTLAFIKIDGQPALNYFAYDFIKIHTTLRTLPAMRLASPPACSTCPIW